MRKKIYWGLGVLIGLLIGAFVLVMVNEHAEDRQFESEIKEAQKLADQINAQQHLKEESPNAISDTPIDASARETSIEHASGLDVERTNSSSEKNELSEAEIDAWAKANREKYLAEYIAKWGEPPSPDRSYQHFFDNHGTVLRHYRGTSVVSHYRITVGFAPTISEFERYKQLKTEWKKAAKDQDFEESNRIHEKIQTLVQSAQREYPEPFGFGYYGNPITEGEQRRLDDEAEKLFYERMGVPHLYELYTKGLY
ncbi:hypothetical protein F4X73_06040 [Candidatus Poribacteria bacterium]|nr:hypothetical protein [Candidatus Poribacteria bacterium]